MVQGLSPSASLQDTQDELHRSISSVALPSLLACAVLLIFLAEQMRWPWEIELLGALVLWLALGVLLLAQSHYQAAIVLLAFGLLLLIAASLYIFRSASLLSLLVLPPLLAALLLGTRAGLAMAALSSLAALATVAVTASPGMAEVAPALAVVWGATLLVIAASFYQGEAHKDLWAGYQEAQTLLDEARQQRVELKQAREDLIQANVHLARLSDRLAALSRAGTSDDQERCVPWLCDRSERRRPDSFQSSRLCRCTGA